ncbi:MAG TPA: AI-2E family transporter [Candidatus Acidoferrales bacterium]|nr:AI-2E family transporter [Candidatus Acidoferrales bacterium]
MKIEAARRRALRIRRDRSVTSAVKILLLLVLALFLLGTVVDFLGRVAATGMLLVAAIFLAYLIQPLVRRLSARMPRIAAIAIVYLFVAMVIALIVLLIVPPLTADAQQLIRTFPGLIARMQNELLHPTSPLVARIPAADRIYMANYPAQVGALIQNYGFATAQRTIAVLLSAVSIVATFIIVPVLAAYILLDAENIEQALIRVVPPANRPRAVALLQDLDAVVGGFIRGQLIDGTIVGTLIGTMLWIMHVPYALLIGVLGGALNLIPYAGAIVSFFPAVILAMLYNGFSNAAVVALLFGVIHQVDGNVIAPRILRANVGLSPVWIILAILGGSELFGLPGAFLAVPTAAIIRVLLLHFLPRDGSPPPVMAMAVPAAVVETTAETIPPAAEPKEAAVRKGARARTS